MRNKILFLVLILVAFGVGTFYILQKGDAPIGDSLNNILPFGSGEDINIPNNNNDGYGFATTSSSVSQDSKFFPITNFPVSGFISFARGGTPVVRYVERATGHIYDFNLESREVTKIANQTLPRVYESYFRPDGNAVLMRTLAEGSDTIENTTLTLTPPRQGSPTDALYSVSANKLRGDIDSIVVGPGNTLYYTAPQSSVILSSTFDGGGNRTILSSPFTGWRITRAGGNLLIYNKSHSQIAGYAYTLNTSSGSLVKVLGPLNALSASSNSNSTLILHSYREGSGMKLNLKNISTGKNIEIRPTTLAEKCVWSTRSTSVFYCGAPIDKITGNHPEDWYLGRTNFTDFIWRFDTASEVSQLIVEPKEEFGIDLDVYTPQLSPAEDYLIFQNRRDLTLWATKI